MPTIEAAISATSLNSPRGKRVLAVLGAAAFLDFVDASITNVALPHIRLALGFSQQTLQWVPDGYLLTYGGLMLLGGRMADLFGRRRVLLTGVTIVAVSSLIGGLADSAGLFVTARLAQGVGAALMLPAALSTLTTTFTADADRHKALGIWGAIAGLSSAVGVLLGAAPQFGARAPGLGRPGALGSRRDLTGDPARYCEGTGRSVPAPAQ